MDLTAEQVQKIHRNTRPQDAPASQITGMQVSLLGPEEIRKSGIEINTHNLKDLTHGLHSTLLGATTESSCTTCNQPMSRCNSHFGFIKIRHPFIYPNYRKIVAMLLNCFNTGVENDEDPLVLYFSDLQLEKYINLSYETRLIAITTNEPKGIVTGAYRNYFAEQDRIDITVKYAGDKEKAVSVKMLVLRNLLSRMGQKDLVKLGMNVYPATNFIVDYIPVLPVIYRPPNPKDKKPHGLTAAYQAIMRKIMEMNLSCQNS